VAEQLLDRPDVGAGFEEVGGEGVAQGVGSHGSWNAGGTGGLADGALDDALVKVVAAALARRGVGVVAGRWEEPLPRPLARGGRVLDAQGVRSLNVAGTCAQVDGMLVADVLDRVARSLRPLPSRTMNLAWTIPSSHSI